MTGVAPSRGPATSPGPRAQFDWQAPWLAPLGSLAPLTVGDWRARLAVEAAARGVANARGLPVRFVDGTDAGDRAYEEHIAATGRVPSRCNEAGELHDLFNALVWLGFPRAKAALNAAQAAAIARDGVGARRGPVRDAATLIDESGLLLADADGAVTAALAAHDWRRALVELRDHWDGGGAACRPRVRAVCFGHALMEKLVAPYKAITAVVMPLAVPAAALDDRNALDAALAAFVADPQLAPARLLRLPVLGVPGWWPANQDPAFYDDAAIFRPRRRAA